MPTLTLEPHVLLLHDAQIGIRGKHLRPFGHAFENLGFDLRVCVLQTISLDLAILT